MTTTIPALRRWFLAGVQQQAPAAVVTWPEPLRRVKYPTGMRGIWGQAEVSAPGMPTRRMIVTADDSGMVAR